MDAYLECVGKQPDSKINALLPASNGGLWIGTEHGMLFWDRTEIAEMGQLSLLDRFQILSMTRDQDRNLWVGTNHGLVRVTPALERLVLRRTI
jgi:ligand-binding sensor domain-containing protein